MMSYNLDTDKLLFEVQRTFLNDPMWQWVFKVGGVDYDMYNIHKLLKWWYTDKEGNPVSLAAVINNYSKTEGIEAVGYKVERKIQWAVFDSTDPKGFSVAIRVFQDINSGAMIKHAKISNGEQEFLIFIGVSTNGSFYTPSQIDSLGNRTCELTT